MNKKVKILGIVVGVLIVIWIAALLVLKAMFPPEKVKSLVVPHVEQALGRKVKVGSAGLTVFPILGLKLSGLEIANTNREGFARKPFVKLDKFVLGLRVMPLLQRRVEIGKILLTKPDILIEIDKEGSFNYDDLAFIAKDSSKLTEEKVTPSGPPALPIPITLRELAIVNGTVVYNDMKSGTHLKLGRIDQRVAVSIDQNMEDVTTTGKLTFTDISILTKDIPKPLSGLVVTFNHDIEIDILQSSLKIKSIKASLQKVYIALEGTVTGFDKEPDFDLTIATEPIAIKDFVAEIPPEMVPDVEKLQADGSLRLAVKVQGKQTADKLPSVKGKLSLDKVMVKYSDLAKSLNGLNGDIAFTENSLNIPKLVMNFGDNPIRIKALVNDFAKPNVDAAVQVTFNLDDVKDLTKLPKGVSVGGSIAADIRAKGVIDPADPTAVDISGNIDLKNVMAVSPPLAHPAYINGTVKLSSKSIVQNISLKIGVSSMKQSAKITNWLSQVVKDSTRSLPRTRVSFDIVSPVLNTDDMFVPAGPATETQTGSAQPQQTNQPILVAPILPGIDLKGAVKCNTFTYSKIDITNLDLNVSVINDVATIKTRGHLYGGSMVSDIDLDARNLSNLRARNLFTLEKVQVNDLVSATNDLLPEDYPLYKQLKNTDNVLHGTLTLRSDVNTNGRTAADMQKNLVGNIYAGVHDGRIAGCDLLKRISKVIEKFYKIDEIEFEDMRMRMRIQDEQVYIDTLDINSRKMGDYAVTGSVGFDASLDLLLLDKLTKRTSDNVVRVQNTGKGAAKDLLGGVLKGTALEGAEGYLDGVGIPTDKEGRITLLIGIKGSSDKPKVTFRGFGKGSGTQSRQKSPDQTVRDQAQKRLEEERKKAEALARQKAEAARKAAEAEAKKIQEAAKKEVDKQINKQSEEVQKKAKKALKGLGF